MGRSKTTYHRKTVSFDVASFDQVIRQVEKLAKAGAQVEPKDFYPPVRQHKGRSRDLPMVDKALRSALKDYIQLRLDKDGFVKPSSPLFITQKGGAYSPNTLQEHMKLILQDWSGVEKASSHSGRRTLITNVIHKQKKSVKVAQKIAGHVNPSTTLIYEEPPEGVIKDALENL